MSNMMRPSFDFSDPRGSTFGFKDIGTPVTFSRSSFSEKQLEAIPVEDPSTHVAKNYKGRIRTWPGILCMVCIIGGAIFGLIHYSNQVKEQSNDRIEQYLKKAQRDRAIRDGTSSVSGSGSGSDIYTDDDGIINNPKSYPTSQCQLPDYQSKKGKLWVVSSNGTEVSIGIKGINWFGMEGGLQAPFGLWQNEYNGTTIYEIVSFLHRNKFNSVRIPLSVQNILQNKPLHASIINENANRALDTSSYIALLQTIVKALSFRQITVMISMHTLTPTEGGSLWYDATITEPMFLKSIDMLTTNLCSDEYWNVLGIDAKNEPWKATWGTGSATDFLAGAQRILNRMLSKCPQWVGFVEGVNSQHSITIENTNYEFYDWFGGGLQKAGDFPVKLSIDNKVVYAPHYYTPAVFPQMYLYGGGTVGTGNVINNYIELSNQSLKLHVSDTMNEMFGYLINAGDSAVLLGEFGGLYAKDLHLMKTTQRCTDYTIDVIKSQGYAGGYMWSLNPESAYQYNPADTAGHYIEGLLMENWLDVNIPFLKALQAMDTITDLKPFPCFQKVTKS